MSVLSSACSPLTCGRPPSRPFCRLCSLPPLPPRLCLISGNQFNHGVGDGGATATLSSGGTFNVVSLDAPNMCPQTPDFPWGNPLPAGSDGLKQLGGLRGGWWGRLEAERFFQ
jgi:hypothetical protein